MKKQVNPKIIKMVEESRHVGSVSVNAENFHQVFNRLAITHLAKKLNHDKPKKYRRHSSQAGLSSA